MPMAAIASSGAASRSPTPAHTTSNRRLPMAQRPPDRHERLRRVEAVLVAPGLGPVAQRLEGAGMRVGPHLALVTRHGGELGVERLGDVDPRVGAEAARERPFGAA